MRPTSASANNAHGAPGPDAVDPANVAAQVRAAQVRAMHEVMPLAQIASIACGLGVTAILWRQLEARLLLTWLVARLAISLVRIWYSVACQRDPRRHTDQIYIAMALTDGIAWGAMGWGLTPFMNLEVAIVTICVAVAASCIGVIMLHIHSTANWIFIVPILIPNAFFALLRHDDLGVFCCVGFLGLTSVLILEGERLNRRSLALLQLRFESELAHQAEKRALQKVQRLADMRSRFVATISHEMRTPLHGMLGLLRLIQAHADQPPEPRHLALMQSSGQHLISVINDVLDFARLESAGLPISPKPFRLDLMLIDLADTIRLTCEAKRLSLTLESDVPAHTWVLGDETRVRQVLFNLLGNAIKFTAEGGVKLTARHEARSGRTLLAVHDSGIGIPGTELAHIFEPFHQAEGTYERRFGGSGLGLTISRELCRAMGGELSCTSQAGTGSVFTCELQLPAMDAPQSQATALPSGHTARQEAVEHGKSHVLIVDDNPVNTIVAEAELRLLGLDVSTVESGQEALDWLEHQKPDLILMDCEMPIMDGVAATRQIRAREAQNGTPPVPIVALTANGREAYEQRCRPAGMNDYLSKPFDRADLKAIVTRHARHAQAGETTRESLPA